MKDLGAGANAGVFLLEQKMTDLITSERTVTLTWIDDGHLCFKAHVDDSAPRSKQKNAMFRVWSVNYGPLRGYGARTYAAGPYGGRYHQNIGHFKTVADRCRPPPPAAFLLEDTMNKLPKRTIALLKDKGFTIADDGTRANYRGRIEIDITWPDADDDLDLCFTFKNGGTLYARPSGVLLTEADKAEAEQAVEPASWH
jgi:hypothetical protein